MPVSRWVEYGQLLLLNLSNATDGVRWEELVSTGSSWSYWQGETPEGWTNRGFDHSAWAAGHAPFGSPGPRIATSISGDGTGVLLKRDFSLSSPNSVLELNLFLLAEDGAIVYLNGEEVARWNVDGEGGTEGAAASSNPSPYGQLVRIPISTSSLRFDNSLSVSLNRVSPASEYGFDLGLVATMAGPGSGSRPASPADPAAMGVAHDRVEVSWADASDLEGGYVIEIREGPGSWKLVGDPVAVDSTLFTVQGLEPETEYDFRVKAIGFHGASGYSGIATAMTLEAPPTGPAITLNDTDFTDGTLGQWISVSLASNRDWFASSRDGVFFAEANGFGGDGPSDDWLISPPINFDNTVNEVLVFESIKGFDGPAIEVLYSTDFSGGNDPAAATWTALGATLSGGDFAQVPSGEIDLSALSGSAVYLAFRYTSVGTGPGDGALWRVTNIRVAGELEGDERPLPYSVEAEAGDHLLVLDDGRVVRNGGYGSGMAQDLNDPDVFYLLTDRGPNFNGAESGEKIFPNPDFAPQIGVFRNTPEGLVRERVILLRDQVGNPLTGLPNAVGFGGTGETPKDLDGNVLALDPTGIDPEGLVVMPDGTFWVADEYGPHIIHFAADGRTIERINPFGLGVGGRKLPREYANRRPNRGMEGLTVTPDNQTLVGVMQSSMYNP
ncbi:MAG: esterase-like activity of phytase family protein, partial [Verrucomicrobiota bacterium]